MHRLIILYDGLGEGADFRLLGSIARVTGAGILSLRGRVN